MSAQGNGDGGSQRSVWTRVNAGGGAGGGCMSKCGCEYVSGLACVYVCTCVSVSV